MKNPNTVVGYVEAGSIAEEAGIEAGDRILTVNGHDFHDILEYRYLTSEYEVVLQVEKKNGMIEEITIENDYEDLGIDFEESIADKAQSCRNKCIFCFIDQLPKGMRDTVYFKDDDTRLSFLQGNYVTLTNLTDDDIDRLIKMRISPINISVHTTNPQLRVKMLKNKNAGKLYDIMKRFAKNNIHMNCQIVLCIDYNDKEELDRTIKDLSELYPFVESVSVVPVGLTAFRDGLCELKAFDKESSEKVIRQVEDWQKKLLEKKETRFVYLADEFYINAEELIPDARAYEGFPQLENGVGLVASMREEFDTGIKHLNVKKINREVSVATGEISYKFIKDLCQILEKKVQGLKVNVYPIKNNFFGGGASVSGLVVGSDIYEQIKNKPLGSELFIPSCMLKADEDIFLDDMSLNELSEKLRIKITPVDNDGFDFIERLSDSEINFNPRL